MAQANKQLANKYYGVIYRFISAAAELGAASELLTEARVNRNVDKEKARTYISEASAKVMHALELIQAYAPGVAEDLNEARRLLHIAVKHPESLALENALKLIHHAKTMGLSVAAAKLLAAIQ